ncbi:hypothetical protein DFH06DRAFT_397787 [Mycena polygramma]|nr:hypothetical protein DFH06DRAFT_397787 [Mycena polygramma]
MFALHPDTGLLPTKDGNKYVPYPSLRATISDLGPFIHRAFDGLEHYLYRDRTNLPALISTLKNIFENGQEPLSLIGTRGAGRTHLITTAASLLLGAKIPVVYLAFSTEEPRTSAFRDALLLALSTSPELLAQADTLFDLCCRTADGLQAIVKFCQHLASNRQKLLFILVKPDRLSHDELTTVGQMVLGHALCSVPSSNSQYRTEMEHKAAGGFVKIMYMNGGLSQLEFTEWIQEQQGLYIPPTEMDNINTATGRVPALLATFFRRVEEEGAFKSEQLLLAPHDVSLQLSAHLESVIQNTPQKIGWYSLFRR